MTEAYDMSNASRMSFNGVKDLLSVRPGDPLPVVQVTVGPPGHRCVVQLLRVDKLVHGFAFKVASTKLCHINCPTVLERGGVKHLHKQAMQQVVQSWIGIQVVLARIKCGNAAEMYAHFGLQPDSQANTVKKEVLWLE